MSLLSTTRAAALTTATAGALALAATPALAAPAADVQADLNGDGTADQVSVAAQSEGTEQKITAVVGGQTYELVIPLSTPDGGVVAPRAVDVNKDRKAELVVTESVGPDTDTLELVDLGPDGLRLLKTPDGNELRFFEGGGTTARAGYTCKDDFFAGRTFTILFAIAQDDSANPDFIGALASYTSAGGTITPTNQIPIFGVKGDNSQLVVDPTACDA
ncbi:hypothetical protein [Actinokineospora bangkokensis]|uniref:VCBS repeat-containing protein n=1 Tax=Actinokineospora bangkokensis TaxID=1193682 RepID=A0A1Q9LCN9_9PSEU|nr:hypothetical protein [Actinokineospora bangkokensis]OLR89779.1 hypothetical protein BJP25_01765 [Actinokineospora bangkokensis]